MSSCDLKNCFLRNTLGPCVNNIWSLKDIDSITICPCKECLINTICEDVCDKFKKSFPQLVKNRYFG